MCLAQGQQRSDASEARTPGPLVSSQALYHWATVLPQKEDQKLVFKTDYHLMRVKSIALTVNGAFCNTFDHH